MRLRRWPTPAVLLFIGFVLLLALQWPSPDVSDVREVIVADRPQAVERVIDGDTLLLPGGHRVRLIGVDTPETKHPDQPVEALGFEASQFTKSLVGDGPVRLEFDRERRDVYHRLLAYVYLPDGRMLNEELIRAGFSEAETRFPYRSDMKRRFVVAQDEAQLTGRGLWAITPAMAKDQGTPPTSVQH